MQRKANKNDLFNNRKVLEIHLKNLYLEVHAISKSNSSLVEKRIGYSLILVAAIIFKKIINRLEGIKKGDPE